MPSIIDSDYDFSISLNTTEAIIRKKCRCRMPT